MTIGGDRPAGRQAVPHPLPLRPPCGAPAEGMRVTNSNQETSPFCASSARRREPSFVPPGYLSVLAALQLFGKATMPSVWTGQEHWARSAFWRGHDIEQQIGAWEQELTKLRRRARRIGLAGANKDRALSLAKALSPEKIGKFADDEKDEAAARERRDQTFIGLRTLVCEERIRTFVFSATTGSVLPAPLEYWRTDYALEAMDTGQLNPKRVLAGGEPIWILVSADDLNKEIDSSRPLAASLEKGPSSPLVSTVAAEGRCLEWLTRELSANGPAPGRRKGFYRDECVRLFSVTESGFNKRIWPTAMRNPNLSLKWAKAGASRGSRSVRA